MYNLINNSLFRNNTNKERHPVFFAEKKNKGMLNTVTYIYTNSANEVKVPDLHILCWLCEQFNIKFNLY